MNINGYKGDKHKNDQQAKAGENDSPVEGGKQTDPAARIGLAGDNTLGC